MLLSPESSDFRPSQPGEPTCVLAGNSETSSDSTVFNMESVLVNEFKICVTRFSADTDPSSLMDWLSTVLSWFAKSRPLTSSSIAFLRPEGRFAGQEDSILGAGYETWVRKRLVLKSRVWPFYHVWDEGRAHNSASARKVKGTWAGKFLANGELPIPRAVEFHVHKFDWTTRNVTLTNSLVHLSLLLLWWKIYTCQKERVPGELLGAYVCDVRSLLGVIKPSSLSGYKIFQVVEKLGDTYSNLDVWARVNFVTGQVKGS